MNISTRPLLSLFAIALLSSWASAPDAQAQVNPSGDGQSEADEEALIIEEIYVTATKRGDVRAQDVGAGITAFDGNKLDRLGAVSFEDFIVQVPGTNFLTNGGPGRGHELASIRGLSPVGDNTALVVAEYLDGAPRFGRNYVLFDIGSVAVLRGPQGTLWGSQAMGGLISYTSNRPQLDGFSASVVGDMYAAKGADLSYRTSGYVNIPIVEDKFAIRIAGQYISESGYIDNSVVGEDKINDFDEKSWRISALWTPTDNSSVTLIYHGNDLSSDAPTFYNSGAGDRVSTDPYTDLSGNQEFDLINLIADVDFEWGNLSYTGSFYDMDNNYEDVERWVFGFIPVGRSLFTDNEESTTHEIRFASNNDHKFDWIVGLYFDDHDSDFLQVQHEVPDPNDPNWMPGVFPGFEILVIGGPQSFEEKALFGEFGYNFNDQWRALVGMRYFDWTVGNDQELTFFGDDFNQTTGEVGDDDSFYKLQLEYRPSDDSMVYLTRSEGFRFGGFNPFVGLPGITEDTVKFDPDTLINYEIGYKSMWYDGRMIFNAAVYFGKWEDVQVVVPAIQPSNFAYTANGGEFESKGFELELITQDLLFPGFYAAATFAYNKGEFQDDVDPNNSGRSFISKGDELRRNPKNTWSFDLGYNFQIGSRDAFVRANYWHKDKTTTEGFDGGDGIIAIPAQDVINASFGVEFENWTAKLYASNLTDETPLLQVTASPIDPTMTDRLSTIRPRTFGLELVYYWQN